MYAKMKSINITNEYKKCPWIRDTLDKMEFAHIL